MMEAAPLAGRRIVVTRPEGDAQHLAARLRALGATPIVVPAIRIEFTDPPELREALGRLAAYDWIVFTSRNGVNAVFRLVRSLEGPRVAAIGPVTAAALRERGASPDVVPGEFVAEAVAAALGDVRGEHILLPRADLARPTLAQLLREGGATVDAVTAYHTHDASSERPDLSNVDAVTFTSSSTVRGFLTGGPLPLGAKVVCIGPVTADTARELGLAVHHVAERYTEDGLVTALVHAFAPSPEALP